MALHIESHPASPPHAGTSPEIPGRATAAEAPGNTFSTALGRCARQIDAGEALLLQASRGNLGALDAGTLIALQAGIYRYTEVVDLAGKLVDRASNSVRSVLQSGAS